MQKAYKAGNATKKNVIPTTLKRRIVCADGCVRGTTAMPRPGGRYVYQYVTKSGDVIGGMVRK